MAARQSEPMCSLKKIRRGRQQLATTRLSLQNEVAERKRARTRAPIPPKGAAGTLLVPNVWQLKIIGEQVRPRKSSKSAS